MNQLASPHVTTKQRDVLDALLGMIEARQLGIGDRLPPEMELARTLGVGRSTVREALRSWQDMGIVSRNKGAGTVLAAEISGRSMQLPLSVSLEAESLLRTLAVRRPLEIEAVRLAARNATERDRHAITGRMLDLMQAYDSGDDWRAADHRFHAAIHEASGNPLFGQIITQLQRAFAEVYEAPFGEPQLGHATVPRHRPLAEAVVEGRDAVAAGLMQEILEETEIAARQIMKDKSR
ncbi:transcriptional regulator, GntR family [Palleronia marisminoris]|uniref:HTH-type transcriptional regulator LutR n=1 Tax=Palleronia marisminoris TaxID=315423 RepID=A0A1Y5S244_9RHOB|nr:FCD domain-containing protein [Palleronia marisminoris]SFG39319.1 transcriptional regulator, GntR family [Palleronia marisminoris]SLN29531.1 HTH-type transcriptional regulator LutR [Palleronia marisminoris]